MWEVLPENSTHKRLPIQVADGQKIWSSLDTVEALGVSLTA